MTGDNVAISELLTDRFVNVTEASRFLGLCRAQIYKIMDSGDLKYAKFGTSRRIPLSSLREYAESRMVSA